MQEEFLAELIALPCTFIGELPVREDNCQSIRLGGGRSDVYFKKDVSEHEFYTIYVRGTINVETRERCNDVYKKLRNWSDSYQTALIRRMPSFVGTDDKHRFLYAFQIEFLTGG